MLVHDPLCFAYSVVFLITIQRSLSELSFGYLTMNVKYTAKPKGTATTGGMWYFRRRNTYKKIVPFRDETFPREIRAIPESGEHICLSKFRMGFQTFSHLPPSSVVRERDPKDLQQKKQKVRAVPPPHGVAKAAFSKYLLPQPVLLRLGLKILLPYSFLALPRIFYACAVWKYEFLTNPVSESDAAAQKIDIWKLLLLVNGGNYYTGHSCKKEKS